METQDDLYLQKAHSTIMENRQVKIYMGFLTASSGSGNQFIMINRNGMH